MQRVTFIPIENLFELHELKLNCSERFSLAGWIWNIASLVRFDFDTPGGREMKHT